MTSLSPTDDKLFEDGPPLGLQRRLGLITPSSLRVGRRAVLVVLVTWVPLVVLSAAQSAHSGSDHFHALIRAVDVHARFLLAAPLFILAEAKCAPRLRAIVRQFLNAGLVPEHQIARFESIVVQTRRLVESPAAELMVIVFAWALVTALGVSLPMDERANWQRLDAGSFVRSPAGWWHLMVSVPVLLVLYFGWLWRLVLWTRLLWKVSQLKLQLYAAQPDRAAGLGFVGHSVRSFSIVGLAVATVVAGKSAEIVLLTGSLPPHRLYFNIGVLAAVLLSFTAPLAVFVPTLLDTWRNGMFEYGSLGNRVGEVFERKWLLRGKKFDPSVLDAGDFSAMTDLNSVVANVYAMRFLPIDAADLLIVAAAMLLPFVPVVLIAVPLYVIWSQIKGLLM